MALQAHPGDSIGQAQALEILAGWQGSETVKDRFEPEPAERLIESVRTTGLLVGQDDALQFIHPLIATTLAAELVGAGGELPDDASEELCAFAAALTDDGGAERLVEMLAREDIFFLARVLRVSFPRPRTGDLGNDIVRYETALDGLGPLIGDDEKSTGIERVAFAAGEHWLAIKHDANGDPGTEHQAVSYEGLLAGDGTAKISLWQQSPFAEQLPELIGAAEILSRFKDVFNALRPPEHPYLPMHDDPKQRLRELARDPLALEKQLVARLDEIRAAEMDMRRRSGLDSTRRLRRLDLELHAEVRIGERNARIEWSWGHEDRQYELLREEPEFRGHPLLTVIDAPVDAFAYDLLKGEVETTLGSLLGSGAWNRPQHLAGWVW